MCAPAADVATGSESAYQVTELLPQSQAVLRLTKAKLTCRMVILLQFHDDLIIPEWSCETEMTLASLSQ
jgi:hypothetical protein